MSTAWAETKSVGAELLRDARQGRLQRSLALVAASAGAMSGLEVAYMHYRASYNQRVMWTPVIASQMLGGAGLWAFLKPRPGRRILRVVSLLTLADCAVGFVFHLRGIHRKPGGFRLLVPNLAMGPPPFAPLLFGVSAYLGLVTTEMPEETALQVAPPPLPWRQHGESRLRRHLAIITGVSAICSGIEALYSHQKSGFRIWAQWTPIAIAPLLAATAFVPRARPALAPIAAIAMADGALGAFYHARGVLRPRRNPGRAGGAVRFLQGSLGGATTGSVGAKPRSARGGSLRRPGGRHHLFYNIMYGPPVLAPLLFAACGFMGLLAALMKESKA